MPATLTPTLLNKLDDVIERYKLHTGDPCAPVCIERLLDRYLLRHWPFRTGIQAVTLRYKDDGLEHVEVTLNSALLDPAESARRRHVTAHEFAHLFCRHRGDVFLLWAATHDSHGWDRYISSFQERQCEWVAAYLLVRKGALVRMAGEPASYVAACLDVPEHLVELRWKIWERYGR